MKLIDEYRDASLARSLAARIARRASRPWVLMEICGGQTHTIARYGLDSLLPPGLELVHGPGCPVCVTPLETLELALEIAARPEVIFVSYGDMLRVPASHSDLFRVRAAGADVRIAYSPLDAINIAEANPARTVVFFAIGFETTAPAHALAVREAERLGLDNFCLLVSHVLVPPAIRLLLGSDECRVAGLIAPGHVCAVAGYREYEDLSREFGIPVVVAGFEPVDLLEAIHMLVGRLEDCVTGVANQYSRGVARDGNPAALALMNEIFQPCDRPWRGLGVVPGGGLRLRDRYARFDAATRFRSHASPTPEPSECISGMILRGVKNPHQCSVFGSACTPDHPLGAPMVSAEGACAAYYMYKRRAAGASL